MPFIPKGSPASNEFYEGRDRFEHWYRDNQVYFLTARCRDKYPAFASEEAKAVFWDRFEHYSQLHGFVPWVTSLMDNHYHTLGYLRAGHELGPMMRKLHAYSSSSTVNSLSSTSSTTARGASATNCISRSR